MMVSLIRVLRRICYIPPGIILTNDPILGRWGMGGEIFGVLLRMRHLAEVGDPGIGGE
jgi:hypothetical protein